MEPEPAAEPSPAPVRKQPVRAAAQKAADKKAAEAEAAAKKKAESGKVSASALRKQLAAQKEATRDVEAAAEARIKKLEAELSTLSTHAGVLAWFLPLSMAAK